MAPFGASTPKGSVHSTRAIISRGNCAPACRKAHRRSQSALRRFLMLIWNRGEGLFAGLALNCLGIQPSQHSWHMDVLAMRARPGGFGGSSFLRLRRAITQAARGFLSARGTVFLSATQLCSSAQESHTALLQSGHMSACSTHPADPPQSIQARAMAPHSMARSPVRSPSGMTHTSHRSWAGMQDSTHFSGLSERL